MKDYTLLKRSSMNITVLGDNGYGYRSLTRLPLLLVIASERVAFSKNALFLKTVLLDINESTTDFYVGLDMCEDKSF